IWFTEANSQEMRTLPNGTHATVSVGRIARMNPDGALLDEFPLTGTGDFTPRGLEGITLGPDGNIWFTESGPNRIGRLIPPFSPGGNAQISEFQLPSDISHGGFPRRITSGPDGNLWFTLWNPPAAGRMSTRGELLNEFPFSGGSAPADIKTMPDRNMWVTLENAAQLVRVGTGQGSVPLGTETVFQTPLAD